MTGSIPIVGEALFEFENRKFLASDGDASMEAELPEP